MEMEYWTDVLAIALCAVVWVTIFVDCRKKLMRVMPTVDQVSQRKWEFSNKISEAENLTQEITRSIDDMRREIEALKDQRIELQDKRQGRPPGGQYHLGRFPVPCRVGQ